MAAGLSDFVLTNRDTKTSVSLTSRGVSVSGNAVTLTLDKYGFDGGPGLFLADANYELTLSPTVADAAGNMLDASGDGTAGETARFDFYKLLGSFISPRKVTTTDYVLWRTAFGHSVSEPGIGPAFDLYADGVINKADYTIWRGRFGKSLASKSDGLLSAEP